MAASNLLLNPYEPIVIDNDVARFAVNPHARLDLVACRGLLYRRFHLSGYLETELVWDARNAFEFVSVNGKKVASKASFWYVPRFDFQISTLGRSIDASIEVCVHWLVAVRGFRLTINQEIVYSEGRFC